MEITIIKIAVGLGAAIVVSALLYVAIGFITAIRKHYCPYCKSKQPYRTTYDENGYAVICKKCGNKLNH